MDTMNSALEGYQIQPLLLAAEDQTKKLEQATETALKTKNTIAKTTEKC